MNKKYYSRQGRGGEGGGWGGDTLDSECIHVITCLHVVSVVCDTGAYVFRLSVSFYA